MVVSEKVIALPKDAHTEEGRADYEGQYPDPNLHQQRERHLKCSNHRIVIAALLEILSYRGPHQKGSKTNQGLSIK